jgi:hypothetical protein
MRTPGADLSADDILSIYLNDHLAAATGGVELFRRAAKSQTDETRRTALSSLADQVEEDRATLLNVMGRLGIPAARSRIAVGWLGEKAGRLKPNGTLLRRSPLSDLVELEAMRLGIEGKGCLWRSLRMLAATDSRLEASEFEDLETRAHAQIYELETMRLAAATVLRAA